MYRSEVNRLCDGGGHLCVPAFAKQIRLVRCPALLWHGLEPLFEDYALATLVWSQQTASAEQIRAITNEAKQKGHQKVSSCFGSECWGTRTKTIKYCFSRSSLHKVGRVPSRVYRSESNRPYDWSGCEAGTYALALVRALIRC